MGWKNLYSLQLSLYVVVRVNTKKGTLQLEPCKYMKLRCNVCKNASAVAIEVFKKRFGSVFY